MVPQSDNDHSLKTTIQSIVFLNLTFHLEKISSQWYKREHPPPPKILFYFYIKVTS